MEQNFQTSFIPKKPIVEDTTKTSSSSSFFVVLSVLVFITVVLAFGGLYLYTNILTKNITAKKDQLDRANQRFEIDRINELKLLDKRLKAGSKVLDKHISISPIFEILQKITMKTVRYTKFSYEVTEKGEINIKMNGQALGYRYIALQSDLFSEEKNLINPVFSNLTLDDKSNVNFDLSFSVDPSLVDYEEKLQRESPTPVENNTTSIIDLNN
ncbi:MAG: hypothetical protein KBD14_01225 [Candidatus Pacebacteria bacterium]|jgi:hypothetical protein|nr:hypothetical protein [Candidatus Paceibacterota bacterium]